MTIKSSGIKQMKIGIVGGTGYTGLELAHKLLKHPATAQLTLFMRNVDDGIADLFHESANAINFASMDTFVSLAKNFEVIFLATPAETSMQLVPQLMAQNLNVIDLSGAFRLSRDDFKQWYGIPHTCTDLLTKAVYGLSPWWFKTSSQTSVQLIANPGCYATCALMSLLPLLTTQLIAAENIIIDAKSGASGAGKKADTELLFCELADNFYPYKINCHQHIPEISRYLNVYAKTESMPLLLTHLLPMKRGIYMNIYADLATNFKNTNSDELYNKIDECFSSAYQHYPLVKYSSVPKQKNNKLTQLKSVLGTPFIHINYQLYQQKLIIFACLDNLLKGAASQAIENFNVLYNLPLHTGLINVEGLQ